MELRDWNLEVNRLNDFFNAHAIPKGPIKVGGFMTIHDPAFFVQACLSALTKEDNIGKVWFSGGFTRLQALEAYILENS